MATRRGSGGRAILAAIELIAAACEACSPWWSNTIRTARARTSGEYGGICLVMAPSFQDQEPPENPVRFIGSARQALVGRERGVAPLLGPAVWRGKPGPRHANRHGAERAHQGPLPMAVAMARHRGARRFGAGLCLRGPASRVTLAAKRRLQLGFEQFLDEGADAGAHPGLQRIKPVLAEKK